MNKLNPPLISSMLPAFCKELSQESPILSIPFELNSLISKDMIKSATVKVYDLYGTLFSQNIIKHVAIDINIQQINIMFNADMLNIGTYYKIQVAFIDIKNEIGYFSNVAVVKYTSSPKVVIAEYENTKNIFNNYIAILNGAYTPPEQDKNEQLYSSYYVISNSQFEEIYKSVEKVHNFANDDGSVQLELLDLTLASVKLNEIYYLQFFTKSLNGLVSSSAKYRIIKTSSALIDSGLTQEDVLAISLDEVTDGLKLTLRRNGDTRIDGWYLITRYNIDTNEALDLGLKHIVLAKNQSWIWLDQTAEQGFNYKYALSRYTGRLYSTPFFSNELFFDFEDMVLLDHDFSLKIRYNGNIKSVKNIIQEQKIDSIGGQYPMFFRNGNLKYKELPIEGLIYYEDFTNNEQGRSATEVISEQFNSTLANPEGADVKRQREFKMMVFDWLSNGKDKLLKTSTEGVFFVKLINVSLTPDKVSGRKYHSFSATAYEVCPVNVITLREHGILEFENGITRLSSRGTWNLLDYHFGDVVLNDGYYVSGIEAKDLPVGTMIQLIDINGEKTKIYFQNNGYLGVSNQLYLEVKVFGNQRQGMIDFTYSHDISIDQDDVIDIKYGTIQSETFTSKQDFQNSNLYKKYFNKEYPKFNIVELTKILLDKSVLGSSNREDYTITINGWPINIADIQDSSYDINAYNNYDLLEELADNNSKWGAGVQVTIFYYPSEIIYKDKEA